MKYMSRPLLLLITVMVIAACGTNATPVWEVPEEEIVQVAEAGDTVVPTNTPVPPTATSTEVPPTATNTPEPPTATPTEEPTEVASDPIVGRVRRSNPENGEALINTMIDDVGFACETCHNVDSTLRKIGPGLAGIQERAATRVEGEVAERYLFNSIIDPGAHVVEDYPDDLMPSQYSEIFDTLETYDIVAYLMTLPAAPEQEVTQEPPDSTDETSTQDTEDSGSNDDTNSVGDAANGERLFNEFQALAGFSCASCHTPDTQARLIGPGLLGIGEAAATRVDGQNAIEYLRNSIIKPSDFVVETYTDALMPQNFEQLFSEQDINDLIAYLLSL